MTERFISPIKTAFALRLLSLLILLQMSQGTTAWGQHIFGGKNIKVFEPSDYPGGNQNWWIEEDKRGFIYVANEKGLLEFDGEQWRNINIGPSPMVRSIAIDPSDGTIYIGKTGDFGYLSTDQQGQLHYQSLVQQLHINNESFSDVWTIRIINHHIYFLTYKKLFCFNTSTKQLKRWESHTHFSLIGVVNNQLLVGQKKLGLYAIHNDSLQLKTDQPRFKEMLFYNIIPFQEDKILLSSRQNILILNRHTYDICDSSKYYNQKLAPILKNNIYYITPLKNNQLAIATYYNGVYLVDEQMNVMAHYNKNNALPTNLCWHVKQCEMGTIWIASDDGIARIHNHAHFNEYNTPPLNSKLHTLIKFHGKVYIGTNEGVFHKKTGSFHAPVISPTSIKSSCQQFIHFNVPNTHDTLLLAATEEGIWAISGHDTKQLSVRSAINYILQSGQNPNRLYFIYNLGIGAIEYNNGHWSDEQVILYKDRIDQAIYEDEHGKLWICSRQKGVFKLHIKPHTFKLAKIEHFPLGHQNLPFIITGSFFHNDRLYLNHRDGILSYHPYENTFKEDSTFQEYLEPGFIPYLVIGQKDNIWLASKKGNLHELTKVSEKRNILENISARRLQFRNRIITQALVDIPNELYLGLDNRLAQIHHLTALKKPNSQNSVYIRKVKTSADSTLYNGGLQGSNKMASSLIQGISYKNRNLRFQFASPFYCDETNNKYTCILEGFDQSWSGWSNSNYKEYTNLKEGTYTFKVKARNTFNQVSESAIWHFYIQPPIYRTWWAYILYLILVIGCIARYLHWSRHIHLHEKKELEKKVQNRTYALSMQKEQLQQQARELQGSMQAQERLALIANKIDNPVAICALNGQLIWANARFYTIFEGAADLTEKKLWEIPGNGEIEDCFWNCLFDKQPKTQQIKNTKAKTDTEYLFQVTLSPALTPTEDVRQIIGVYSDVTNLHELNKIRDMLMSVITHDLKSPLLAFKMISETLLLQLHAENHPAVHKLNHMCNQASTLYTFTRSLSDWLKNQRGKINFTPQAFKLNGVVSEVIQLFRFQSDIKQIRFRNLVAENLEIRADHNMLKTIFRNLFSNAILHTDRGSIVIQAHTKGQHVIIKVKDNGLGAAEQNLFNGEHTGFGLFICEEFIKKNNGKIWQEAVTTGTCIGFTLPLAATQKADVYEKENYNCR
ncbi:MAG: hypothetical protein JEZ14_08750 [Marinilabiliaceae bacterium]|nr:hypothetical protein [Marinilabiliaceae bacterium]